MNPTAKPSFAEAMRRCADEIVDEYAYDDLETLAMEIEEDAGTYEEGEESARAVAAELRKRAAAGVRKWPGPKGQL